LSHGRRIFLRHSKPVIGGTSVFFDPISLQMGQSNDELGSSISLLCGLNKAWPARKISANLEPVEMAFRFIMA
jgi:hypothetical protein